MEYAYVVLRRGRRPLKSSVPMGMERSILESTEVGVVSVDEGEKGGEELDSRHSGMSSPELLTILRRDAYHWPKLIVPPLKRAGHIILDSCTPEGTPPPPSHETSNSKFIDD